MNSDKNLPKFESLKLNINLFLSAESLYITHSEIWFKYVYLTLKIKPLFVHSIQIYIAHPDM